MTYYELCYTDDGGKNSKVIIKGEDDKEVVERYREIRNNHPRFRDWRLWKPNLPWKPKLIAGNEG
ncbi:MAG: hypothetical protein FJZ43_00215 [Candidatus Staskawiczbacteria bacterium]|nr:hypothetical protein [Candidatus Staskawiczbacteria bacterium]